MRSEVEGRIDRAGRRLISCIKEKDYACACECFCVRKCVITYNSLCLYLIL